MLVAVCRELHGPQRRVVVGWLFCYTGLSWVDYRRFCEAPADYLFTEPATEPGQLPTHWIRMVRQKMKKRKPKGFSVPLFEPAAMLLLAWRGCLPHTGDVNTNKLLHQVEAHFTHTVLSAARLVRTRVAEYDLPRLELRGQ